MRVEYIVHECDYPNCETEEQVVDSYRFLFTRVVGKTPAIVRLDLCTTHRDAMWALTKHFRSVGVPEEN